MGNLFAVKVMDKAMLVGKNKLIGAQTESEILTMLDHPFLPTLYSHFETDELSCLVMEFCSGGDLHVLCQRQPGNHFSEQAARFYASEVLLSIEYLHMMGIIYRDLKPENVLVREDGHIMLSDFDLSLRCAVSPRLEKSTNQASCFNSRKTPKRAMLVVEPTAVRSMSFVGTYEYLAPEMIRDEGHGSAVDWWTFGVFLYELLHGITPFKGNGNRETMSNIVGQSLKFPKGSKISFAAKDLIRGLLVKDPQKRLGYKRGAAEIKQHPFFKSINWALIRGTHPPEIPEPVDLSCLNQSQALLPQQASDSDTSLIPYLDSDSDRSSIPHIDFDSF